MNKQLIKLGQSNPELRKHIAAVLDATQRNKTASNAIERVMTRGLQKAAEDFHKLTDLVAQKALQTVERDLSNMDAVVSKISTLKMHTTVIRVFVEISATDRRTFTEIDVYGISEILGHGWDVTGGVGRQVISLEKDFVY